MAHKKGLGSSRNGRDSHAQRLGVKKFAGEYGFGNVAKFLFIGIIGGNFLFELALNAVLVPVVKRVLKVID